MTAITVEIPSETMLVAPNGDSTAQCQGQPGIEMSITHIPCTNQAFIKDMNLPLMSS